VHRSKSAADHVLFYGGGSYDFTVYALSLVGSNAAQNEQTFEVVSDETFTGDAKVTGLHNLSANFAVGAADFLAFAGLGPYYTQRPNNAIGSDATYASSSEPNRGQDTKVNFMPLSRERMGNFVFTGSSPDDFELCVCLNFSFWPERTGGFGQWQYRSGRSLPDKVVAVLDPVPLVQASPGANGGRAVALETDYSFARLV
jgi:hypothetical protein